MTASCELGACAVGMQANRSCGCAPMLGRRKGSNLRSGLGVACGALTTQGLAVRRSSGPVRGRRRQNRACQSGQALVKARGQPTAARRQPAWLPTDIAGAWSVGESRR